MVNTHLKFEAKIPNGSKLLHSQEIKQNLKSNLTLKVKVKVISFQTQLRYLDDQ